MNEPDEFDVAMERAMELTQLKPGDVLTAENAAEIVKVLDQLGEEILVSADSYEQGMKFGRLQAGGADTAALLEKIDALQSDLSTEKALSRFYREVSPTPIRATGEGRDDGWLPIVLCPTDGVDRLVKLTDGREVVANFDGSMLGRLRWQMRTVAYHNPARIIGQRGGVDQWSAAYDTFLVSELPDGVYPVSFRPNDTVHGRAEVTPPPEDDGPVLASSPLRGEGSQNNSALPPIALPETDRGGEGRQHRFGSPPEPVANPSEAWCDAYADWYYQGRG